MDITEPTLIDRRWVWPDGTTLPLVSGGSDAGAPDAPPAPAEPAGEPPAEPAGDFGATPEGGAPAEPKVYDEEYVKKLRQEAAGRRTAIKPFEEAFEGWDPDARDQFLDIAKQLRDPKTQPAVAKRLREISDRILEAQAGDPNAQLTPTGEPDPDAQPLTRAEFKRMQEEQEQARILQDGIASIHKESEQLGVPPTIDGEDNPEFAVLMQYAQHPEVAGDLTKAFAKLEKYRENIVESYRKKVEEKAGAWPGGAAPDTPSTPPASADGGSPKTWKEARKGALAYLNARPGQ